MTMQGSGFRRSLQRSVKAPLRFAAKRLLGRSVDPGRFLGIYIVGVYCTNINELTNKQKQYVYIYKQINKTNE